MVYDGSGFDGLHIMLRTPESSELQSAVFEVLSLKPWHVLRWPSYLSSGNEVQTPEAEVQAKTSAAKTPRDVGRLSGT